MSNKCHLLVGESEDTVYCGIDEIVERLEVSRDIKEVSCPKCLEVFNKMAAYAKHEDEMMEIRVTAFCEECSADICNHTNELMIWQEAAIGVLEKELKQAIVLLNYKEKNVDVLRFVEKHKLLLK